MSHLGKTSIDIDVARFALEQLEIDDYGLDRIDRMILACIVERFGGGPVGVETIAASVSEDAGTIEEMYEPYLIQQGFLQRTPRGRMAAELAYKVLGVEYARSQSDLFRA
jgi:Holliday junction DNA helicase RuvB